MKMAQNNEDESTELLDYLPSCGKIKKYNFNKNQTIINKEHEAIFDNELLLPVAAAQAHNESNLTSPNMSSDNNRPSPEGGGDSIKVHLSAAAGASNTAQSPQHRLTRQSAGSASSNGTYGAGGGGGGSDGDGGGGGGAESSNTSDEESDVIGDLVGHFGRWQLLMTLLLSLFQVPNTFHIISSVYQSAKNDFWCKRPNNLKHLAVSTWRNLSHSQDNCHQNIFFRNYTEAQNANDTQLVPCIAWEYDINDNVGRTWSSEWDLVCSREYLLNVAEMVFLLGVATGGIVSGYLSDKFGRKKMLFITASLQTIIGIALYFADSFALYTTLRCLLGLVSVAVTYSGLILAIEYVDGKWRTIAGMYNLFPLPISYMIISGIAYLTQDYKKLQLSIGIPGFFLLFLWFVVPESPRWLLIKGRISEVVKILESIAKFNKRPLPPNYESLLKPPIQERNSQTFLSLFKSPYLRCITICFICIWFTINLVYYGIILNMNSFGGNVYLNSALAGLVEIPAIAIAIYIISKVGKKWLFCATLICGSIACGCAAITEGRDEILWLKITFLMIGKFTISAGNTIMPVYTAELYPTAIRNAGVGACNVAAGIALILTPYLSLLNNIEGYLMMVILTCWSLFGGLMVLFLPERAKAILEEQK